MLTNTIITNFNKEEQERIGKILLSMGCSEGNFTRYDECVNFIKVSENGEFGNYGRYCDIEYFTHLTAKEFFEKYDKPVNKPKFKVGDKVKVLSANIDSHLIGKTVRITKIENGNLYVEGGSSTWCCDTSNLELVETKSIPEPGYNAYLSSLENIGKNKPLTETIITDIKDEEQADRICKKLESIGIKRCGILKKATDSFNILQILGNKCYIWYDSDEPLWTHITASEFLGEDKYEPPTKTTGVAEGMVKILEENLKNNNSKAFEHCVEGKKTNNMSIVNFFNDLTVSGEDKELRKAGLKDSELNWTSEAKQIIYNLEAKERGYKNSYEMEQKVGENGQFGTLEADTLFTKFYPKLLETAKKYNRKDEVKKYKKSK